MWQNFKVIAVDNIVVDFVVCTNCHHVLTYRKKDGTKGMLAHKCFTDVKEPNQSRMTSVTARRTLPECASDHLKT